MGATMRKEENKHDLRDDIHAPKVSITPLPSEEEEAEQITESSEGAPLATPSNKVEGQTSKM